MKKVSLVSRLTVTEVSNGWGQQWLFTACRLLDRNARKVGPKPQPCPSRGNHSVPHHTGRSPPASTQHRQTQQHTGSLVIGFTGVHPYAHTGSVFWMNCRNYVYFSVHWHFLLQCPYMTESFWTVLSFYKGTNPTNQSSDLTPELACKRSFS